jgi:hypothetical protein
MEKRKAIWYSIIRYSPDNVSGEIINVGLVLHGADDEDILKYFILDEASYKLRSISNNSVETNIYKNYKEVLEYYLSKCNDDLMGIVGDVAISSCYEQQFLDKLYKHYMGEKLTLTKPNFAFTENPDKLFDSLAKIYIGERYFKNEPKTITVKTHIKELFEQRNLLGKKIKTDLEFKPIENLDNLRVRVDFGFKNGAWNYIDTVPPLNAPSEISEWFAKTKFAIETLKSKDNTSKIHLIYRLSDFKDNITPMFDYLTKENQKVNRLNIEENQKLDELCDYIEKEAEYIDEYAS